jgi:hypothetical protein
MSNSASEKEIPEENRTCKKCFEREGIEDSILKCQWERCKKSICSECFGMRYENDPECTYCKKTFCKDHISRLSCTCAFSSFHFSCHKDDFICLDCMSILDDDKSALALVSDVYKLVKKEKKKVHEKELEICRLETEIELLKIEHKIHMNVYHPTDDNKESLSKKRKTIE